VAERIKKGQVLNGLPAKDWNEFVDTAQRVAAWPTPSGRTGLQAGPAHGVTVLVKPSVSMTNDYPIVRLTTVLTTPTENTSTVYDAPTFNALKPDADTGSGFAVIQGPSDNSAIAPAMVLGDTWCKVDVQDTDDEYATSINDDCTKLKSSPDSGARILWKESGTGEKWAVVRLRGSSEEVLTTAFGMVTTTVTKATSIDGTLKTCTPGIVNDAVALMKWNNALTAFEQELDEDDNPIVLPGVNITRTDFRATTAVPVMVTGFYVKKRVSGNWVKRFVITGPFDIRQMPNYDTAQTQILYHAATEDAGKLGGTECS
jgi:hypothetical protein